VVINPDTFDNLEDLISDVEFVVECRVSTGGLALDIELHQTLQEMVIGKLTANKLVAQDSSLEVHQRPSSREKQRDQRRLEIGVLDVLC
jgi:hypothetical protein